MTFIAAKRIASSASERCFHCVGCGYTASGPTANRWHECATPPGPPCGPGCQLRRSLAWWGIRDDGKCGCDSFAAKMDAWGPDECWKRIEEIVEHLRQAAEKKGLPFIATAARIMVGGAIEAARAEATPPSG
jgi:hypothetical protein